MASLSDGTDTVALPAHLQWQDEAWTPVAQSATRVFGGGLVVQATPLTGGRPITLVGAVDRAWLDAGDDPDDPDSPRTILLAWHAVAGQQLTLSGLRGLANQTIIYRHEEPPCLVLSPIDADSDHVRARYWRLELRLRVLG